METRGGGCATTPYRTPQPGDSAIPEKKACRMAEETLLHHSAPFVFPRDPSIAFSPGDGRAGRRPSPRISASGAEGRGDRRKLTVQNLGEASSPWFCFVPYLVGLSIAQLSPRVSPRPVSWAPVLRKVLAGHQWPDPPKGTPTSLSPRLRKVETEHKGLCTPGGVVFESFFKSFHVSIAVPVGHGDPGRWVRHLAVSHPTTEGFGDPGAQSVQNGGGYCPPSFCTVRIHVGPVYRLLARRWTSREGPASPRIWAPGAEGRSDRRNLTVQTLGEDSSPWFCIVV